MRSTTRAVRPAPAPSPTGESAEPGWRDRLNQHPMAPYYLILGAAMLLLALGLVMVLSSSSVESIDIHQSAFTLFIRQAIFAVLGVAAMFALSRLPIPVFRRFALVFLLLTVVLLLLVFVPGIGAGVHGQRNWIKLFGPFRLQPSEFAKLALIVWSADLFARKDALLHQWRELAWPFAPVAAGIVLLILAEGDLGTAIIVVLIIAGLLWVVGAPTAIFAALGAIGVAGVAALSLTAGYRMERFTAWLHPEEVLDGAGWQLTQGKYALGTGGWWGVGLGSSREKWGALPEAHTDFIFPVVGEELGLFGALTIVGLFAAITVFALRLAIRTHDPFVRVVTVGIVSWLIGQALVNLGAVLQLLPITGVPLPFVSYGGSSLLPSLMAIGVLLSFARAEAHRTVRRRAAARVDPDRAAGSRARAGAARVGG